ncbi:hypothetical protein JCM19233_1942 [Vibrio astriarenae]|nr:hypothetical protein JCM19233_1942 [Vibrio sp. C7]
MPGLSRSFLSDGTSGNYAEKVEIGSVNGHDTIYNHSRGFVKDGFEYKFVTTKPSKILESIDEALPEMHFENSLSFVCRQPPNQFLRALYNYAQQRKASLSMDELAAFINEINREV